MESSNLINYLTNKCQSDQGSMVMEHAHKYEKRGVLLCQHFLCLWFLGSNYKFIGEFEKTYFFELISWG